MNTGTPLACDTLWTDARVATMAAPGLGVIEHGLIAAKNSRIVHVGPIAGAPAFDPVRTIRCEGRWITPGLIDCHTHLVHAGSRAREFEMCLEGASYEAIARAGGGIVSTMMATRETSEDQLVQASLPRLDALMREGVTTIEIKSGYGLSVDAELKMLRAAKRLGQCRDISVVTSFLGAHAVPPEFIGDSDGYIAMVCAKMIPAVADEGLADAVDAFCEGIGFSPEQVDRVFRAAGRHGLPVKLHAEQLSNLHGSVLAARHGALSADHLEHLDEEGVRAMAHAGTVATLLPGAFYFLRESRRPPVDLLRAAHVPIAVATDCNPGTSPLTSLLLAMNLAATLFRLTVEECLVGVTRHAARALGLQDEIGTIEVGKSCDLAIWNVERPAELVYRMGFNSIHARIRRGQ